MANNSLNIEQLTFAELEVLESRIRDRKTVLTKKPVTNDQIANNRENINRNVVVIGGAGQLGGLFCRLLSEVGLQVKVVETNDWLDASEKFAQADLVLVAVPIHVTEAVIKKLPKLAEHCILADITSVKTKPVAAMCQAHRGPVLGLHPMFGPGVDSLNGQTVVTCEAHKPQACEWFIKLLAQMGAKLVKVSPEGHDRTMAFVQVLRHFSTVVYGRHLAEESEDLERILSMSSPIYRLELAMVGRLFAQDPDLYTEIIFANKDNIAMMHRYADRYQRLLSLVETNDKKQFKKEFAATTEWFGEYAKLFLDESSTLLKSASLIGSS